MELCQQMIDALSTLEPGISNSAANVQFELCFAKIAQIKRHKAKNIPGFDDAKTLIAAELINLKTAYDKLLHGSEGRSLLESRLKRVIDLSS